MIDTMKNDKKVYGLTDHIFTPTFIDDIANALPLFLTRNLPGIYHLVGSSHLSTIDAVKLVRDTYQLKAEIIPIDRKTYFKNRAFRPFKLALKNDKIQKILFKNSGQEAISKGTPVGLTSFIILATWRLIPTGTVDLVTTTA